MALKSFFRFRQGFNGLYLAGLQRDRFQLLSTKALAAQLKHRGIVKDAVQRTQQGRQLQHDLHQQQKSGVVA